MSKQQLILVLGVFAAAVATRAFLITFPYHVDLLLIRIFSDRLVDVGPLNYYSTYSYTDQYLPAYLYVLWGIGSLKFAFAPDIAGSAYLLILKLPANFFDIATGVLIFAILRKRISVNLAILGSAFYLFTPAIFYNSAVWGQFAAVPTFFLLAAVYLLLERKPELSAMLMAVAFLLKAQAIALFPVFALALVLRTPPKRVFLSAALAIGVFFLLPLPFFWRDPIFGVYSLTKVSLETYQYTSANAFNLWWIFEGSYQSDGVTWWFGLNRQMWGSLLWLVAQVAIGAWLFIRRTDDRSIFWAASLALFAFFILPTRIHERYLFSFFSFFLVSAMLSRQRIPLLILYAFLSVLHFLNLYFVLQKPPYPIFEPFFSFALSHTVEISYLLVGSFAALLAASLLSLFVRRSTPREERHAAPQTQFRPERL